MVQNNNPRIIHQWVCDQCGFSMAVRQDEDKTTAKPPIPFESVMLGNGRAEKKWCPLCISKCFGGNYVHQRDVEIQKQIQAKDENQDGKVYVPVKKKLSGPHIKNPLESLHGGDS